MENQIPKSYDLGGVYQTISGKKDIYLQIIQKSYQVDESAAANIFDGELETLMIRLQNYWNDPKNHKTGAPTITAAQGANIFLEVMQAGLSFSEIADHVYVSRMKGTGTSVGYKVTVHGDVYLAQKAGALESHSEVVLVQHGEHFNIINNTDGRHIAQHTIAFDGRPPFSINNFLVGYVYMTYPNGNRELSWLSANRLKELMAKSSKPGNYNDETFVQTKVLRHAMKKVRKTPFMQHLQRASEEAIQQHHEFEPTLPPTSATYQPTMIVAPATSREPF